MRFFCAAAVAAMLVASGSICLAADPNFPDDANHGTGWVVSVDVVGSPTGNKITLKQDDTIRFAGYTPKEDYKLNDKMTYKKGVKYNAFLLDQKKNGEIVTQTFMVLDEKQMFNVDDRVKSTTDGKINIISSGGVKETAVGTGQRFTIAAQDTKNGTRDVTIETFEPKANLKNDKATGGFSFYTPKK